MNSAILSEKNEFNASTQSASKIQQFATSAGYLLCSAISVIYAHFSERQFLADRNSDGFTNQVLYIWDYFYSPYKLTSLDPLFWIHSIRAIVAAFFVYLEDMGGNGLVSSFMILLTLPVFLIFFKLKRGWIIILLPIAAMALSNRAFLVAISISYIMLFIRGGSATYFLTFSFLFSNLSAGAVANSLLISLTLGRNYRKKSKSLYVFIIAQLISIAISAADKYSGFYEQRAGYEATIYGATGIGALLSRSTIFASFLDENYARLFVYLILSTSGLALFFLGMTIKQYRGYAVVLLTIVPSMVFEGLGLMSLLVPILLFLAGEHLPWKPGAARRGT